MVVADAEQSLTITGNGDVLEPHDGIIGMQQGSFAPCALLRESTTEARVLQPLAQAGPMRWLQHGHSSTLKGWTLLRSVSFSGC